MEIIHESKVGSNAGEVIRQEGKSGVERGRRVLWINPLLHCEYVLLSFANKKLIGTGNIHLQKRTVQ